MNAKYIVGAILIALGIAVLSQTGLLTSSQMVYYPFVGTFDKLIISLRTAYAKEYSLDKEQTSYSDSIDALRLACKMYKMK